VRVLLGAEVLDTLCSVGSSGVDRDDVALFRRDVDAILEDPNVRNAIICRSLLTRALWLTGREEICEGLAEAG
jgi:hypothetical protein